MNVFRGILGYVDPGSGFVFLQNASFLWVVILGLFGFLFLFFKFLFRFIRRFFYIFFILITILIIGWLLMQKPVNTKKVVILGIDAMDPKITEQLMREGRLPSFTYLKTVGSYSHLITTIPAESVVAWTSFSTGVNPGSHGIFDFIMRNPNDYTPYLSLNEISTVQGKPKILIRRKGETFWNILSKNKIPSYIYFCPNTFPPERLLGRLLSGMGVPDLYGTMGRFSFYTTKILSKEDKDSRGKVVCVKYKNNIIKTQIHGPRIACGNSIKESVVPIRIILAPEEKKITLEFQGNNIRLLENEWSTWQRISFKIGPFRKAFGIVRFYLKSIKPELELYMTPINFDPQKPIFPISYPKNYSSHLAKNIGLYSTLGMPHDTWALTENKIDEKAFLESADSILEERKKILFEELKKIKEGIFFFYFDTLDALQHMFWRYIDPRHSLYEEGTLFKNTIFDYYEKMDEILGAVMKLMDKDTILIVLSDHGFSSFRKSVHLNRWLLENGYLYLREGISESKEFFEDVDWFKTKAYALGFGGIYLNRAGREGRGIVSDTEARDLKQAIAWGLKKIEDKDTGETIVKNVYFSQDIFKGPYTNDAADLFVGFNEGYRASWQTALGGVPGILIEDNKRKWSGDHLVDSTLVPGVIFVNRKMELTGPSIIDITPTILGLFKISKPTEISGTSLFDETDQ